MTYIDMDVCVEGGGGSEYNLIYVTKSINQLWLT